VAALLKKVGLSFARRSETPPEKAPQVLLLDTFGELGLVYAIADAVFVGGSLVPVGGHNLSEAAAQSKPVLYGPHMHNFRESRQLLEAVGAGVTIHNAVELAEQVQWIVKNEADYKAKGEAARQAVLAKRGAAARTVKLLVALLEEKS
jgi:3-deoxy-D-manno-octulosonic-acid transferase